MGKLIAQSAAAATATAASAATANAPILPARVTVSICLVGVRSHDDTTALALGVFIHNCHSLLHPIDKLPPGPTRCWNISPRLLGAFRLDEVCPFNVSWARVITLFPAMIGSSNGLTFSWGGASLVRASASEQAGRFSRFVGRSIPTDPGQLNISRTLSTSMETNRSYEAGHFSVEVKLNVNHTHMQLSTYPGVRRSGPYMVSF